MTDADRTERIAVVFIHGQGEQIPMKDPTDLAMSVWRTDSRAWPSGSGLAPVYSVPVYDKEASSQRRIVTQSAPGPQGDVKVDFYQFYWADLMQGNRFTQLWTWFVSLAKKNPRENVIPEPIAPLRRLVFGVATAIGLWALVLAAVLMETLANAEMWRSLQSVAVRVALASVFSILVWLLGLARARAGGGRPDPGLKRWPGVLINSIDGLGGLFRYLPSVVALFAIGLGWVTISTHAAVQTPDALAVLLGSTMTVLVACFLTGAWNILFSVGVGLVIAICAFTPFADYRHSASAMWIGVPVQDLLRYMVGATLLPVLVLGAIGFMLYRSFLLPVMTESARLFTASPDNIPNANRIRERGLKLLEDLHASDQRYDRIVVLAHSLGTAVGYDLLTYYWGKVNGRLDHRTTAPERQAVEDFVDAQQRVGVAFDLAGWRRRVRAYGAALAATCRIDLPADEKRSSWRISDFITIGCPLTYASFLLEPTDKDFHDQVVTYRRYATSPPQPVDPQAPNYGLVPPGDDKPHHAALFAATCWTNLYFPNRGLIWGDIVGGPIRGPLQPHRDGAGTMQPPRLGYGILDVALRHDSRLGWFTHNDYWPWPKWARPDNPPQHIEALRAALHLFMDSVQADQRLLSA